MKARKQRVDENGPSRGEPMVRPQTASVTRFELNLPSAVVVVEEVGGALSRPVDGGGLRRACLTQS